MVSSSLLSDLYCRNRPNLIFFWTTVSPCATNKTQVHSFQCQCNNNTAENPPASLIFQPPQGRTFNAESEISESIFFTLRESIQ